MSPLRLINDNDSAVIDGVKGVKYALRFVEECSTLTAASSGSRYLTQVGSYHYGARGRG